jgi:hypothetical protein
MTRHPAQFLLQRIDTLLRTPFGCLLRVFLGRMFHGGGETGAEELDLGVGVLLILLAMPGLLVSLLMFEKYGSLIRYLRGEGAFDPFKAAIPDEYFFIVLSMVVTGIAALWRWDSIFLDRRDFTNLVPQPVSLRSIFFANLSAILVLAGLFTIVVNAASLLLFPVAVAGSRSSFLFFLRFAAGHAIAVLAASSFSFFAVFAIAGGLMAVMPTSLFRRISLLVRFAIGIVLLGLIASVFTVPDSLVRMSVAGAQRVAILPPISFLGVARTIWTWGRGSEPFVGFMTRSAWSALGLALCGAVVAYTLSFRRSFLRTPETAGTGPLPRLQLSSPTSLLLDKTVLRAFSLRACYRFAARTLLRSNGHLQVVLGFAALGLVASAEALSSIKGNRVVSPWLHPPVEFLSVPLILSYCLIVGIRFAFEIPADLAANWIFRMGLSPDDRQPRQVARRLLLAFSLSWLAPACFVVTLVLYGWLIALLHTAMVVVCDVLLVEVLLVHFRKIPFTCSYPAFQSNSGVILVAYLFGFFVFTGYIPEMERWALLRPATMLLLVPLFVVALLGLRAYRKQILDMDKQLIFEEPSPFSF